MSNGLGYILADVLDIFGYGGAHLAAGALGLDLLYGESDGLGVDFTDHERTVGRIQIKDTTTAANIFTGAPIDKLTYSSPSVKMCVQSDGTIKHASHNLFTQTDDITDASSWTDSNFPQGSEGFGTDFYGTFEGKPAGSPADGITFVFTGQYDSFHTEGTRTQTVEGVTYRVYADIYNNGGGTTNITGLDIQGSQFPALSSALADGEWTNDVYYEFTATTTGNNQIGWQDRNTSGFGTFTFRNVRMLKWPAVTTALPATGTSNEYQLPYSWKLGDDRVTYESRGIRTEEARTNLSVYSTALANAAYTYDQTSSSASSETDPTGNTDATLMTASATNAVHRAYDAITLATGTDVCISVYAKAGTHNFIGLAAAFNSEECFGATFDLSDGTFGESDVGTTSGTVQSTGVESVGNGWYRCWVIGQLDDANPLVQFSLAEAKTGNTFTAASLSTWLAAGTETVSFYGLQAEATSSGPSSLIVTGAASATRAIDNIRAVDLHTSSAATVSSWIEHETDPDFVPGGGYLWQVSDGTGTDRVFFREDTDTVEPIGIADSVTTIAADKTVPLTGGSQKTGWSFAANDFKVYHNGLSVHDDTSCAAFADPLTYVDFATNAGVAPHIGSSYIKKLVVVPRQYTDAELDTLTSPTTEQGAQLLAFGEGEGLFLDFTYDFETNSYGATTGDAIIRDKTGVLAVARNQPYDILTYTSPSPKMALQDDGNLLYGPHNLLPQSAGSATNWTKVAQTAYTNAVFVAPNGAVEADSFRSSDATSSTHEMYYIPVTTTTGVTYGIQTYMKADTGNPHDWVQMASGPAAQFGDSGWCNYDLVNGVIGNSGGNTNRTFMEPVGDGWYRCGFETVAESGAASQGYLIALKDDDTTTRNPNSTVASGREIQVWGHTLYKAPMKALQIPTSGAASYELPHEWDTGGTSLGVLPEEARTNDMTYSLNLGGSAELGVWQVDNASFTDNAAVSPTGLTDAVKLVEDTSSNNHQVRFTKGGEAINQVVSVYAKAGERSIIEMQLSDFVFALKTRFDLSDGTIDNAAGNGGNWTNVTNTITSVGNGWYRCSMRADNSVAAATDYFWVTLWTTTTNYAGDGTSGCYLYGAQWEEGTTPSSLIETGSATATRAADKINLALSATPLPDMTNSAHAITIYNKAEVTTNSLGRFWQIDDGAQPNNIALYTVNTTGAIRMNLATSNADQVDAGPDTDVGDTLEFAMRATEDDYALSITGETQTTDTTADVTGAAVDTIRIGYDHTGGNQLDGHIQKLSIVPRGKTNAELEDDVGN